LGSLEPNKRTVTFDHEWFDDIVLNQLKTGMADAVGDARLGTGEKVVERGYLTTGEHDAVDQMGVDEACTTCDEDELTASTGEKLDRGKRLRVV
jgi:hypothetical protein